MPAQPLNSSIALKRRERLAWKEYRLATNNIQATDPRYRQIEQRAWKKLQYKLRQLNQ